MVELTLLAARSILRERGLEPVIATRTVVADAPTLLTLVSDPASQWRLAAGVPAWLSPSVHVVPGGSPRVVKACLRLAGRDAVWFTWIVTPGRGTSDVDLAAQLESRSVVARLAMVLGGQRRLRRRLDTTLGVLAALALHAAEDLGDVERHGTFVGLGVRHAAGAPHDFGTTPTQGAT